MRTIRTAALTADGFPKRFYGRQKLALQQAARYGGERKTKDAENSTFNENIRRKKAVDDLNLHILPGEIYGFIGHNGAGKTTTIKSVAGILQFDAGEILIDGVSVREAPIACKRKIAYIPDNPDLYDYMTGIRFLNFIADIFKVSPKERTERIEKYAGLFELTADLAQPIARIRTA